MAIAVGDSNFVRVEVQRGVALLTVDRPPANALDLQVVQEIGRAATQSASLPEVGAIVITGHGEQFVAGADIKVMRDIDLAGFAYFVNTIQRALNDLEALPLPVIAAINGNAMGGGLELALACDLRFAGEHVRLGVPEVRLGLLPGAGGTQRLCESVGKGRALELLYTGRPLGAAEAHTLGLVNRVVEGDRVVAEAVDFARQLASGARQAMRHIKSCVLARLDGGRSEGFRAESAGVVELFAGEEARVGFDAFINKRPPAFGYG
ncbi:enoyl-CoA hydratase [Mycobacterium sp. ENV421]|uniref:enoyl-CoA hydratase/isomerase family protein n=1 Tax=Mycobacterium sp. ENV421 TaxID=1213407 RepID=UPI000C9AFD0E|nr:enoyl-CoA hydratase-related protein [Mycobacterium sp. ENV421]PND54787.1 enoyl-CoA hydratase [Mycobacterium sp. ENV421]